MRSTTILLGTLVAAAGLLAPAAAACNACRDTGKATDPRHRPPTEFQAMHSSWLGEKGLGLGWYPCPRCEDEQATRKFEAWRQKLESWVIARRQDVDMALFGDEPGLTRLAGSGIIRHAESENFRLITTAPPQAVMTCDVPEGLFPGLPSKSRQKRNFTPEQYDLILLKRAEDELAVFQEIFLQQGPFRSTATSAIEDPCKPADGKYDIFLWDDVAQHLVCARKFFGTANELGTYKHGNRMSSPVGTTPETRNDEQIHRYLTHILHHLFLEAYGGCIGFDMPAWVPESFAHYTEWKRFGDFKISCYFERKGPVSIPGRLEPYVLKLVASRQDVPAASLVKKNYNTMEREDHVQIWSLMHFLIDGQPREKFIQFIRLLKQTRDQLKAFKEAYGYSLIAVDEPWREFVMREYR